RGILRSLDLRETEREIAGPQNERISPPAYPDIVRTDEDRDRFGRLYDDLVRVLGLSPAEALLNAATQFELGFDVRGPFEKRKRRSRSGSSPSTASAPPSGRTRRRHVSRSAAARSAARSPDSPAAAPRPSRSPTTSARCS